MHDQGLLVIRLQANPKILYTHSFENRVTIHSYMKIMEYRVVFKAHLPFAFAFLFFIGRSLGGHTSNLIFSVHPC